MKGCRDLTREEQVRMLGAIRRGPYGSRNGCLFTMGCEMGPRVGELVQLRLQDVMENNRVRDDVILWKRYRKRKPETKLLPVTPACRKAMQRWIHEMVARGWSGKEDFLFQGMWRDRRRPICAETVRRILKRAAAACGIGGRIAAHTMRKTFAQRIFDMAVKKHKAGDDPLDPIIETMDALGQKDPKSTIAYLGLRGVRTRGLIMEAFGHDAN